MLFTAGPLLLSVKGIIDLAQMPPTILLPHPGATGSPTMERIAYLPGAQPPFPPRPFNQASISPGEDHTPSYSSPSPFTLPFQLTSPQGPSDGGLGVGDSHTTTLRALDHPLVDVLLWYSSVHLQTDQSNPSPLKGGLACA